MKRYVRQARLPDGAYPHLGGLEYYAKKQYEENLHKKDEQAERGYVRCEGIETQGSFKGDRCIQHVNERQEAYSTRTFSRILCWRHQSEERHKMEQNTG